MISYVGSIPLIHIELQKFKVEGVDNDKIASEVLSCQQRMSSDPTSTLFEDTVFNPHPDTEGAKLLEMISSKALSYGMRLETQWSHIHQPLESTGLHNHITSSGEVFSFVYYVRVPPEAGMISFVFNNILQTNIAPAEKDLYIFPSWVDHKVSKNLSKDIRISISGNFVSC